jgi:hypothetical protein
MTHDLYIFVKDLNDALAKSVVLNYLVILSAAKDLQVFMQMRLFGCASE